MSHYLGRIAAVSLTIAAVSLALAYAFGGRDLVHLFDRGSLMARACGDGTTKASGSERRLAWNGGDSIDIALPATVRYRSGEGSDVVVRGAPDVISHVELRGGRLALNCRWHAPTRDIEITLPAKPLQRIAISGSATVAMEKVDQPELKLSISGSGSITAQGAVDRLNVAISGAGKARLSELAAKQLTVEVSGSGNVEAAPIDEADIRISGSGKVNLLTRPIRLNSKISGSGRISQPPLEAQGKK
jgi:hypothetical protein